MLKTIIIAPVIIGCALAGTVGMLKATKRFFPERFHGPEVYPERGPDEEKR